MYQKVRFKQRAKLLQGRRVDIAQKATEGGGDRALLPREPAYLRTWSSRVFCDAGGEYRRL
jgi:hypothetical protein